MVAFTWQRLLPSGLVIETGFGLTVQILPEPSLYLTQRSRLGRFPLCTPLRLRSTGTVPACLFASAQRSNRCRPMEPTNWGANYTPGWLAKCTPFLRLGFVYSMSTALGRIQNRPIPG